MNVLARWELTPAWLPLLAAAAAYLAAARRAGTWPARRTALFMGGLGALAVALCSGLDADAEWRLSAHMVQHLLLGLVAAPLLVAGGPVRLALRVSDGASRRRIGGALHAAPVRVLAHPAVGCALFVGVLGVVHVPAVYDLALREPLVHALEHAALFWSAVALWAPLVAVDPVPHRVGAIGTVAVLTLAMTGMGAISAALAGAPRVVYAPYGATGLDALADQSTASGIMAVGGMLVIVPVVLGLAWRALLAEERRARARESRA